MYLLVTRTGNGEFFAASLDALGAEREPVHRLSPAEFRAFVVAREPGAPRWVWEDSGRVYPTLLGAGIRVRRCHDLRLCHVILRNSALTATSELARAAPDRWDGAPPFEAETTLPGETLFDLDPAGESGEPLDGDARTEFLRQLAAVAGSEEPGRLRLLLAAESVGALIAVEMQFAGLPWRTDIHERLLTDVLGPRVAHGVRPERLERLAGRIRTELGDPAVNPDSQQDLLRALQRTGLAATSTRAWELKKLEHPVIAPLLEYKKLSRLLSANGWYWMDTWIIDGRFHPDYVPGGVVTGRWATRGGGALQLPRQVRGAVVADAGWKLVVADAAQLEPRILAALSADTKMATAGRGTDLYAGIVASGVVETRDHAKVAMLGAMYGATTGESGRLLPKLAKAYPRALGLTESAARAGERGDVVTTRLGRSSPRPGEGWQATQAQAYDPAASSADERRARSQARDWGRFTRNFIVQGSAAEWALCWMAEIRRELWELDEAGAPGVPATAPATARQTPQSAANSSARGPGRAAFSREPHLVFFLHDEVIVHTPAALVGQVEAIIARAAATAGRLLFGNFPVDFMLTVATVDSYAEAK